MTAEEEKEEIHLESEMERWGRALWLRSPRVLCQLGLKSGTHLGLCGLSIERERVLWVSSKQRKLKQLIFRKKADGRRQKRGL